MMLTHRNSAFRSVSAFTLIELMIVVAIIAIIASVVLPKLMAARLAANESAAMSVLRSLSSAESRLQSQGLIDSDGDGIGEYGYFGELSGTQPCRVTVGGMPTAGVPGKNNLYPALLIPEFGNVTNCQLGRSGYIFQIYLPDKTVDGPFGFDGLLDKDVVHAISEDSMGGKNACPFPDPNNCEDIWCAYAWPVAVHQTGDRVFFINQEGVLIQTGSRYDASYSGSDRGPKFDAAFSVPDDMSSLLGVNGVRAVDSNVWTPVFRVQ